MSTLLIAITAGLIYLICDFAESRHLAALQELARLTFVAALIGYFVR